MSTAVDPSSRERIGPYRIVARVGAGGMGEVFKAWDPRLERDVAIKLLHPETAANPDRQRRLVADGRAVNDVVDVFGSYSRAVMARNTHVLDRALMFGASARLQKSALERGIVNLSAGNRIARCACQKGLALKR